MKRYSSLLIILLLAASVSAQTTPTHYFGFSLEGGYSHLFLGSQWQPYNSVAKPLSGGGGGAALYYELEYNHFLLRTGFGVDYTYNRNQFTVPDYTASIEEYSSMQYHYTFNHFVEATTYGVGYVPIMIGCSFNRWYMLTGAKIGFLPFWCFTQNKSTATVWATDDDIIDPLYDEYTHDMKDYALASERTAVNMNRLNAMFSFEIGLNLNKHAWATEKEAKKMDRAQRYRNAHKKQPLKERTIPRLALFADYGFNDLHNYSANPVPYEDQSDGGLLAFNGLTDITPYSALNHAPYKTSALNNLLIGIKLSVSFGLPKKAPKKGELANPLVYVYVKDELTQKPLGGARVEIQKENAKKPRLDKATDAKFGRVSRSFPAGNYWTYVSKSAYVKKDTIHFVHHDDYDTLYVSLYPMLKLQIPVTDVHNDRPVYAEVEICDMAGNVVASAKTDSLNRVVNTTLDDRQPYIIKATANGYYPSTDTVANLRNYKGIHMEPKQIRSVVFRNMYFATGKTKILPSSNSALIELYALLQANPDLVIRIVGHTDDVSTDEFNQTLSEGRAESVRQEMINRGIDGNRILTAGHGEKDPVVPNDSDKHRQMNRRVEVEVVSGVVRLGNQ